ncbi:MAG: acyl-ACP--UDP-N-acetylglucosamine O-acyltransferase [Chitinophagales bacterium]
MANISDKSEVHPDAKIGKNVTIGPFCYIDEGVEIGEGTRIEPHVTIYKGATIGKHCHIFPGAVIAAIPQDLKYEGEETTAEIGDYTTIREYVTINKGTAYSGKTVIGSHCLLMAYVHVAHDCVLGNQVILANDVNLAGHVEIEDWAILEGTVAVQQFIRIGRHSFIAGGSLVRKNVPPYVKAAREPLAYAGVNSVGLIRRGFNETSIKNIQDIYREVFIRRQNIATALEIIENDHLDSEEKKHILSFIRNSPKGIMKSFNSLLNGANTNGTHSNTNGKLMEKLS